MVSTEERRASREAKLDELHEQLTEAVGKLVSGEDWAAALRFAARFRSRSFNNTLLIWMQHTAAFEDGLVSEPMPSYVAGYKRPNVEAQAPAPRASRRRRRAAAVGVIG